MGDWPNRVKDLSDVTTSSAGPPTSGTWNAGDVSIDTAGAVWVCTAAGTPGTWASSAGGSLGSVGRTSNAGPYGPAVADVAGMALTVTPTTAQLRLVFTGIWLKDATSAYVWSSIATGTSAGTELGRAVDYCVGGNFVSQSLVVRVTGLTPGVAQSYHLTVQCAAGTGGAVTLFGGTTAVPLLEAFSL